MVDVRLHLFRCECRPQVVCHLTHAHDVVRVIQHVARIVHVCLEALDDIVVRLVSSAVLKERIVPLVRLEGFRQTCDARRQLAYARAEVDADRLERVFELVVRFLCLEMRRVALDKADGLVSVRYKEVVDRGVEFVIELCVLLDRVLDLRAVDVLRRRVVILRLQPVGILPRQIARAFVEAEFPRGVFHLRAIFQVFRRRSDAFRRAGLFNQLLDGSSLFQSLRKGALVLVQCAFLAVRAFKGSNLVKHAVDKALALLLVLVDRLENSLVDLLALLPAKESTHNALRRAMVKHKAFTRVEELVQTLSVDLRRFCSDELARLLAQRVIDLDALLLQEPRLRRLLCRVIVHELKHARLFHAARDICHRALTVCDVSCDGLFPPRRAQALLGALRCVLDALCRLVIGDKLFCIVVDSCAVRDLHAQLVERFCALEFVLALDAQPLSPIRRALLVQRIEIGIVAVEAGWLDVVRCRRPCALELRFPLRRDRRVVPAFAVLLRLFIGPLLSGDLRVRKLCVGDVPAAPVQLFRRVVLCGQIVFIDRSVELGIRPVAPALQSRIVTCRETPLRLDILAAS